MLAISDELNWFVYKLNYSKCKSRGWIYINIVSDNGIAGETVKRIKKKNK